MGSWVDDFSSFRNAAGGIGVNPSISPTKSISRGGGTSSILQKQQTRADKIKAELKLLEWHKLANDSAIKAALMQTKILKEDSTSASETLSVSNANWMKQVLDSENNKPLEVSKDFIIDFERTEKETQEKLTNQMERHIATLKTLRTKLEEQSELQARQEVFRDWNKDFRSKKAAVLTGKTLSEIGMSSSSLGGAGRSNSGLKSSGPSVDLGYSGKMSTVGPSTSINGPSFGPGRELSTVLESLSKLAELERRISTLERDNAYEDVVAGDDLDFNPKVNKHTTLEFRKKRTAGGPKESVRSVFSVRERKQAWLPVDPLTKRKKPQPAAVYGPARGARTGSTKMPVIGPGNGRRAFLTEHPDYVDEDEASEDPREAARRERARQLALAPAGQKELRVRVQQKKERAKVLAVGARRHELALQQMNQRRTDHLVKAKPAPRPALMPSKGAAAGVRFKNRHLQEFDDIKKSYAKRRENGPAKVSRTVPARSRAPPMGPKAVPHRIPATQIGGTVTRRSNTVPKRRPAADGGLPVAGTGISGVRGLRAMK